MTNFGKQLGKHNADTMLAELFMEDLTKEQFRTVWTTYCIMLDLRPDTAEYDNKLLEIYDNYWSFSSSYDEYDLFMGELLVQKGD